MLNDDKSQDSVGEAETVFSLRGCRKCPDGIFDALTLESCAGVLAHLLQDERQGAKTGEGGLQQVQPDEGGEQVPVRADLPAQQERQKNHEARKSKDNFVDIHHLSSLLEKHLPGIVRGRKAHTGRLLRLPFRGLAVVEKGDSSRPTKNAEQAILVSRA